MLGFKSSRCARAIIAGIEPMHMIKKGQVDCIKDSASSASNKFYSLAFGGQLLQLPSQLCSAIATEPFGLHLLNLSLQ